MFNRISDLITDYLSTLEKELKLKTIKIRELDAKKKWDLEIGEKFNDLICKYAISEEELLSMAETVCKFVDCTRITNINKYLFEDEEMMKPRILKNITSQNIFKDLDRTTMKKLQEYEKLNLQLLCLTNLNLKTIVEISKAGSLYVDIDDKKISLYEIGLAMKKSGCDFYTIMQNIMS